MVHNAIKDTMMQWIYGVWEWDYNAEQGLHLVYP